MDGASAVISQPNMDMEYGDQYEEDDEDYDEDEEKEEEFK